MKCHSARGASLAILLAALTSTAWCQDTGLPSLFPLPPLPAVGNGYPVAPAAAEKPLNEPFFPHAGNTGYDAIHYEVDLAYAPRTRGVKAETT